ncbi:hypothetical protein OG782_23000 [Streptomyces sp. NBC_00876]|uniref:hypothetical protein n=1 Tax=Streptomyces sp. NBC_00876 TaxID=2975853 RepID=UPI0038686B57|nr:hypothetical protein OG782_23000 [Streptomyces sp. NBC_00876]
MSTPVPPPNQPQPYGAQPQDGNPYAGQQPGAPTGNPFAGQQPGGAPFGGGAPFAPVAPARNNIGLGILAGVVAALVAAVLYGVIAGSIEREVGYIAVGVGFLVGFAASKVGGSNPALTVVSALLSIGAVYLGQLVGVSVILADLTNQSAFSVFFDHFDAISDAWSKSADFKTYLFLAIGALGAIGGARKAS